MRGCAPGTGNVIPHNTHVLGDYLITSYYTSGVTVIDASDPFNLIEVAYYDTSPYSGGTFDGCWGAYPYLPSGLVLATDSETAFGVNDASGLSPAQTVLIGSEQMYITGISSNTLTVERGVNGTTASTHTASTSVYIYVYPTLVVQACLDLSKIYFRDRDLGVTQTIGTPEMGVTRSDREAINVLKTLDTYRATTTESQVFF